MFTLKEDKEKWETLKEVVEETFTSLKVEISQQEEDLIPTFEVKALRGDQLYFTTQDLSCLESFILGYYTCCVEEDDTSFEMVTD